MSTKSYCRTFVLVMAATVCVNAQTVYGNNQLLDNTYIGVTGGAATPLDFNSVFPLNGFAGLKLGKDITPVFGFNIEGLAGFGTNAGLQSKTTVKTVYAGLNGTINWSNAVVGYNPSRLFTLSTETGLNYIHAYGPGTDDFGAKTGVTADFRVSDPLHVYIEPTIFWNLTEGNSGLQFNSSHAQLALQVGVVYRFKTSNGTHNFKKYDIGYYEYTIAKLNEELAAKPKEVIKEVQVPGPIVTITDTVYLDKTYTIMFAYDSADLTPIACSALDGISGTVQVTGYASPEGTEEYNMGLSERRAQAVADYLNNRGVTVQSVVGAGVDGEASNRVVIVSVQ